MEKKEIIDAMSELKEHGDFIIYTSVVFSQVKDRDGMSDIVDSGAFEWFFFEVEKHALAIKEIADKFISEASNELETASQEGRSGL